MSLFGKPMEVDSTKEKLAEEKRILELELVNARQEVSKAKEEVRDIKWKLSIIEKENDLANEKKLHELRKTMQESLIKSDLLRTEALAKLEIYEKTDTKADSNVIKDMLYRLVDSLVEARQAGLH